MEDSCALCYTPPTRLSVAVIKFWIKITNRMVLTINSIGTKLIGYKLVNAWGYPINNCATLLITGATNSYHRKGYGRGRSHIQTRCDAGTHLSNSIETIYFTGSVQ